MFYRSGNSVFFDETKSGKRLLGAVSGNFGQKRARKAISKSKGIDHFLRVTKIIGMERIEMRY